jgi:hypothetical protein
MGYIKKLGNYKIGDKVKTTKLHESCSGIFEIGTEVTIVDIDRVYPSRGYAIEDEQGNRMIEIGWTI